LNYHILSFLNIDIYFNSLHNINNIFSLFEYSVVKNIVIVKGSFLINNDNNQNKLYSQTKNPTSVGLDVVKRVNLF